jgi:hypothetical protein
MAGAAPDQAEEAAAAQPPSPSDDDRRPQQDESVHYLWRRAEDANDADAANGGDPSHHPPPDFDPWRIEAEREAERRASSRRAALTRRGTLRLLLWLHLVLSTVACASGGAAALLSGGRLLRRVGIVIADTGRPPKHHLECYASADPRSLSVCQVSVGLGCLSSIAWPLLYVLLFLAEAAAPAMPPCGTVRPRYGQLSFAGVLALAWGATAAGALSQRAEADAAGVPYAGVRLALAAMAAMSAVSFLVLSAVDGGLVFLLSTEYAAGTLQGPGNAGIFEAMFPPAAPKRRRPRREGEREAGVEGEAGQGAEAAAAVRIVRKAPFGVESILWAPPVPLGEAAAASRWWPWSRGRRRQQRRPQANSAAFEMF